MAMGKPCPLIALLTDFGNEDVYVGVMKSVIAGRCSTPMVDLSHSVTPQNIAQAAYLFSTAYRFLPGGAVALCVVDPGVGTERAAIAVEWPGGYFVGPDNGWLTYVVREARGRDSAAETAAVPDGWTAVELANPAFRLPAVSGTFHGRDIFAPATAALASGTAIGELGPARDSLVTINIATPVSAGGDINGQVIHVDHFGNLVTNITKDRLARRFSVSIRGRAIEGPAASYQENEPLVTLVGSSGHLEIAVPNGSAAE